MNNLDFLDIINILSFLLQVENNNELEKQSSNDDIMQELRKQDTLLFQKIIEQNEIIIKQNNDILSLLKGKEKK